LRADGEGVHHHHPGRHRQPAGRAARRHLSRRGRGAHRLLLELGLGAGTEHHAAAGDPDPGPAGLPVAERDMKGAPRWPGRLAIAAVLLAAALVPVLGGAYLTTFLFTLLYAYIVAQSWDWLHGEAGYVNLGHYIFFGVGAYAFAI